MEAHGSFAFKFEEKYTLITASNSWNVECAEIYDAFLRKRVESNPGLNRCVIIDGRNWTFDTPECGFKIKELHRFLSGYYTKLYIAYYLSPGKNQISKYLMDQRNRDFSTVFQWDFFLFLDDAISWLNSNGFSLPNLTDEDFPKPVRADQYLKFLGDP